MLMLLSLRISILYLYLYRCISYCAPEHDFPLQSTVCEYVVATALKAIHDEKNTIYNNTPASNGAVASISHSVPSLWSEAGLPPGPRPAQTVPFSGIGPSLRGPATLFLVGAYAVGKEKILVALFQRLKVPIYVNAQRLRRLRLLDLPGGVAADTMFTTDPRMSRIHVVPLSDIRLDVMVQYVAQNNGFFDMSNAVSVAGSRAAEPSRLLFRRFSRVVAFKPTGWTGTTVTKTMAIRRVRMPPPPPTTMTSSTSPSSPMSTCGSTPASSSVVSVEFSEHHVPYSEHSSFTEMREFVRIMVAAGPTEPMQAPSDAQSVPFLAPHAISSSSSSSLPAGSAKRAPRYVVSAPCLRVIPTVNAYNAAKAKELIDRFSDIVADGRDANVRALYP